MGRCRNANQNKQRLQDIKQLTRARLVASLNALANRGNHAREQILELFLTTALAKH